MILLQEHFFMIDILLNLLIFSNNSIVKAGPLIKTISVRPLNLYRRDNSTGDTMTMDDSFDDSSWQWGRWIFFILFVLAFFAVFIFTFRTNKRRINRGEAPIRGTSWITPPSYRQSEQEYYGTTQRVVEDYVPEYTEEANINDLGYYDERGEFHPNGKAEYLPPPPLEQDFTSPPTTSPTYTNQNTFSLERPGRVVVHENEVDYTRPSFVAQQYYNMSHPTRNHSITRESQTDQNVQNDVIQEYSPSDSSSESTISTHMKKSSIKVNVKKES